MKSIVFFNNKGGVGTTSLVYHLAYMFGHLGVPVVAVDLDPQANLSSMFLDADQLIQLWKEHKTIEGYISPLFDGAGSLPERPHIERPTDRISLLASELTLSKREDELSSQWPKCLDGNFRAFRVITAFSQAIATACREEEAELALLDVGPNLGAINRAALINSDYVVIPMAPDLFSLQGLRNVGPTLNEWRAAWRKRREEKPDNLDITLPDGSMQPLGYIVMRYSARLDRPSLAFGTWIDRFPGEYAQHIKGAPLADSELAQLRDYRSLMPLAQEARKPMFQLKPADGAIGALQQLVLQCYYAFRDLARTIAGRIKIELPNDSPRHQR